MRRVLYAPLAIVLVATACTSSKTAAPAATTPATTPATRATPAVTAAPATSSAAPASTTAAAAAPVIDIENFAYNELTVLPGTTITAKNLDGVEHTVTSDKSGLFKADDIDKGTPVTFTAPTTPGTYTFHCDYHPKMHGTLIVT